ncbi:MAG: GDP-mannose 4,6-dehydratase [Candidatus Lokiarchaeota archaeon]|nr:GDP-mannose 4,6-dehydratase [Candidatus Lokiarchaeota archaeon]
MKFLITGGLGFLGSNLSQKVLREKEEIIVLDNFSKINCKNNLKWLKKNGNFKLINQDVRNQKKIDNIIKNIIPDVIFHTAGQTAVTKSIENPRKDFEINVGGTINLLEAIRKYSPQTILVYSSTNKVYGDLKYLSLSEGDMRYHLNNSQDGLDETLKLDLQTPYGCSKGAADQYVLDYASIYGLRTTVFRHSAIYGPRQYPSFDQGWVSWFCLKGLEIKYKIEKDKIKVLGNGKQVRDVLYVEDAVNLYFNAISKIENIKGIPLNIGGGFENSLSILELISFLEKELNIDINYEIDQEREADQKYFVSENKKVKDILDWKPKISFHHGLKKLIIWLESNLKSDI